MKRLLVLPLLVMLLAAGCSSDDNGDVAAPGTTAAAAVSTSTASTDVRPPIAADCPEQPDSSAATAAPTQGSAITDGFYFGFITALDAEDLKITFDAAQMLTGDAAAKAAAEDGGESPPPNDYWIRNKSRATRVLVLAEDAVLCTADPKNVSSNRKITLVQLNKALGDGEPMPVWIDVREGTVERVQQQFFP